MKWVRIITVMCNESKVVIGRVNAVTQPTNMMIIYKMYLILYTLIITMHR